MIGVRDRNFSGHVWVSIGAPLNIRYAGNTMYNNMTTLANIEGLLSDYYMGVF